ncbi:MAG TPA: hypothetical protein VMV29_22705, partial [Ktedonobacterales bacterium]|nr:hypothetical protein [Ktedonobacterales bacterium]
ELYRSVRGVAPDLLVYFGDLAYRALGTVGGADLFSAENDTGPDDANHAQYGLFVYVDPQRPAAGTVIEGAQIYDVAPTLLARFGVAAPAGLRGRAGALWATASNG